MYIVEISFFLCKINSFSYSDEVFSQQSRKMSESSSLSELELASDGLFHQIPSGPGGDTGPPSLDHFKLEVTKRDLSVFSRNDFIKLKAELSEVLKKIEKYDLDKANKQDLESLSSEISNQELKALLRYDLSSFKKELQNKYHAELEILREDYENRIDALNVEHDQKLQSLERKNEEKIESLKFDLEEALRNNEISISSAVQEVVSFIFVCLCIFNGF